MKDPDHWHPALRVAFGLFSLLLMVFLGGFFVTSNRPGEPSLSGDLLRSVGIQPWWLLVGIVVVVLIAVLLNNFMQRGKVIKFPTRRQ